MRSALPFSSDLDWLMRLCESAFGACSTTGAMIAMIERGVATSGMPATDPVRTAGTIDARQGRRWSRVWESWRRLDPDTQSILAAHYADGRLPLRVEAHLGEVARASMVLAHRTGELGPLVMACERDKRTVTERWATRGRAAVQAAHIRWQDAVEATERRHECEAKTRRLDVCREFKEADDRGGSEPSGWGERLAQCRAEERGFFSLDREGYD